MTCYRYAPKALRGDYLRAGGGVAITGAPILLLPTALPVTVVLSSLAILFGIFGLRTALRRFTVIETSDEAITVVGARRKSVAWRDIRQLRLDYFSTRRDGQGGWMQMRVTGPDGHIRIDSTLEGFARLAAEAANQAAVHGVQMTETTKGNFGALGVTSSLGVEADR